MLLKAAPNVLAGLALDRMAERRADTAWLAARLSHPSTRIVLLQKGRVLMQANDHSATLLMLQPEQWSQLGLEPVYQAFLGVGEQGAVFAITIMASQAQRVAAQTGCRFAGLRSTMPLLSTTEAGLAAYARALSLW